MQLKLYISYAHFFFAKKSPMQMQSKIYSGYGRFYHLDIVHANGDWNTTEATIFFSPRYLPN